MKKLFAILLVALFATTFAFAQTDTWSSSATPQTGTFNATVICDPGLTGPTGTPQNFGNFFQNYTSAVSGMPAVAGPMTWGLTGDPLTTTFVVTITGPTAAGANTGATLTGVWSIATTIGGGNTYTFTNEIFPYTWVPPNLVAWLSCSVPMDIIFTPTFFSTIGATPGANSWTCTVSATASL